MHATAMPLQCCHAIHCHHAITKQSKALLLLMLMLLLMLDHAEIFVVGVARGMQVAMPQGHALLAVSSLRQATLANACCC